MIWLQEYITLPGLFIWVLLVQTDDLRLVWQTLSHLPAPRHSLLCFHSFPCLSNRASRACFSLLLLHGALLFLCRCSVCPGCLCFKMCRFLEEAHLHPDPPRPGSCFQLLSVEAFLLPQTATLWEQHGFCPPFWSLCLQGALMGTRGSRSTRH